MSLSHIVNPVEKSPLEISLDEIVSLLGNHRIAQGWAQSVKDPLEEMIKIVPEEDRETRGKIDDASKELTTSVNHIIDSLVRDYHLKLGNHMEETRAKHLLFAGPIRPFEDIYEDGVYLSDAVLPPVSWFRDRAARYNLQRPVQSQRAALNQGTVSERFETGIQLLTQTRDLDFQRGKKELYSRWGVKHQKGWIALFEGESGQWHDACGEWKDYFEESVKAGISSSPDIRVRCDKQLHLLANILEHLELVIKAKAIHPQWWHLLLPRKTWLEKHLGSDKARSPRRSRSPPRVDEDQRLRRYVGSIVKLLGNTELVQEWGKSVVQPIEACRRPQVGKIERKMEKHVVKRLESAIEWIMRYQSLRTFPVQADFFHSEEFFFSGAVPSFEALLHGYDLEDQYCPAVSFFKTATSRWTIECARRLPANSTNDFEGKLSQIERLIRCDKCMKEPIPCNMCAAEGEGYFEDCHLLGQFLRGEFKDRFTASQLSLANNILEVTLTNLKRVKATARAPKAYWKLWIMRTHDMGEAFRTALSRSSHSLVHRARPVSLRHRVIYDL